MKMIRCVAQFSRGCPHVCNYCRPRGFWARWRHKDPHKFAAELAWLYRSHGVEAVDLADENPTACREGWLAFLKALIAEKEGPSLEAFWGEPQDQGLSAMERLFQRPGKPAKSDLPVVYNRYGLDREE
jgi:pyruvate-formate lyase-activating enzyme